MEQMDISFKKLETTKQAIIRKNINEHIRVLKVEFPKFKDWDYIYRLLEPVHERWYEQKNGERNDDYDRQ